jgi:hypothetical protein
MTDEPLADGAHTHRATIIEARAALASALGQMLPSDDAIIRARVEEAYTLLGQVLSGPEPIVLTERDLPCAYALDLTHGYLSQLLAGEPRQ